MKATHLRALRDNISAHIDVIRAIQNHAQKLTAAKTKMVKYYAEGVNNALEMEDDYLTALFDDICDYIAELEKEDVPKGEGENK